MKFEFYTANRIIFGSGTFHQTAQTVSQILTREKKAHALLVLGGGSLRKKGIVDKLINSLSDEGIKYTLYEGISDEPQVETVDEGVEIALKTGVNLVIGLGGGSVIDTAKAIAGLITNGGSVGQYLEGVGDRSEITRPALPYIAVPTTAGTGAEVTKNAVISSRKKRFKKSIRSSHLIPTVALVDPQLTLSLPPHITAGCGMDALTQLMEPYLSRKAQPISSALAIYGIPFIARSLENAVKSGEDLSAREDMCLGSLLSGIALANSGLGAVHGISASLGANFGVPHGMGCGILLPYIMELNYNEAMESGNTDIINKFGDIGEALTGNKYNDKQSSALAGVEFIKELSLKIGIPSNLKEFGIKKEDIPLIVKGSAGSSMSGNPVHLSEEKLTLLLDELI